MKLVEADGAAVTSLKGTEDDISIVPLTATSTVTGTGSAKIFSGHASPRPRGPASVKSFTALPPIVEDNQYHQHYHPIFLPLPEYKPPSVFTRIQWHALRAVSFCLSLAFLTGIVLAASVRCSLIATRRLYSRLLGGDPEMDRPFWQKQVPERNVGVAKAPFEPSEGGQDSSSSDRNCINPSSALQTPRSNPQSASADGGRRYPILMLPGLLQSAGAFCVNDDDSLAFFLAKSGYDIWLGSNRYGFHPEHISLTPSDPRFWSWTIRDMATFDLPALVTRVLYEANFPKLALIGHSQGAAETFLSLSKHIQPSLGSQISIFCALSPAAYSGPLLKKFYLKFMREPYVRVVHSRVIEEYEHLDVIWAINSIEKVGTEVKSVIWDAHNRDNATNNPHRIASNIMQRTNVLETRKVRAVLAVMVTEMKAFDSGEDDSTPFFTTFGVGVCAEDEDEGQTDWRASTTTTPNPRSRPNFATPLAKMIGRGSAACGLHL
ncbi:triacylglycerol lipase [Histoplasma capsulatum H143]|uniref:Triacylglycerol lipase n=1 Tax=Ajellomyces capsulatus (strain H143) TaxID=544712 RepID=C6HR44_AJECH|nr:triacylglycerol lipase [Histoplasma capsulatum H143]